MCRVSDERDCCCAGRVLALVSDDARRVSDYFLAVHDLVSLPLQIAAALFLLYTQVRLAFLAGLVIALALVPLNRLITVAVGRASSRMLAQKDARLDVMATLLSNLRAIFMLGWQDVVVKQARSNLCPQPSLLLQASCRACVLPLPLHSAHKRLQCRFSGTRTHAASFNSVLASTST